MATDREGRILAIGHDVFSGNLPSEQTYEGAALQTRTLYAGANRLTRHRLAPLDIPIASSMRAPGESVGLMALECAMDELAEKLDLDPVELRVRNEPSEDPEKHIPYSSRHLVGSMQEGARRFGWDKRNPKPGQIRDGRWLVGMGMAAATRGNPLLRSKANVRLDPDGTATVRMAMTDIGTGTYTILAQIAAEMLGLPTEHVRVELGDTDFPQAAGSGGSWGAGSSGSALYEACNALREKLARTAGMDPAIARFADGSIATEEQSKRLTDLVGAGMDADGEIRPGRNNKDFSQQSYGAHFAEVGVDEDTGEVRLHRMLGVFTAGRILNAKTARSQAIGGMVFGVGAALHEEMTLDPRFGYFVNHDLAEYHVPVHADIPAIEAIFLAELDDKSNPLKSKGIGELGICGAGASIANAVYNACGVRVRDYPITLDKLLPELPVAHDRRRSNGIRRRSIVVAAIAIAAAAVLAICLATSRGVAAGPEATPSSHATDYLPSISDMMIATIQPRHERLWRAEQDGNWEFAAYELGNLQGAFNRLGPRPSNSGRTSPFRT